MIDLFSTTRPAFEPTTGWQHKLATDFELNPYGRTAGTELFLGHQGCQGPTTRLSKTIESALISMGDWSAFVERIQI
jgi:hypothetical protein